MGQGPLLKAEGLVKHFPVYERGILMRRIVGYVHAVDGISFEIKEAETLALVGESGSGKTTTGKLLLYLEQPDAGRVYFNGMDVGEVLMNGSEEQRKALRRQMQMIFQNPYGSLDPRMTVFDIISEPFVIHGHVPKREWEERVYQLLRLVGLEEYHAERYPHEFSGGQRQRIAIARALATEPKFIVADEPVSSLDVSVRAQVLNLLREVQRSRGISFLYITHDLSSARQISQRVAVMYLGKILEYARTEAIFGRPLNPYTMALLSAVPVPDPERESTRLILPGEVPSPINPPRGCRFHPRCPYATDICRREEPPLRELASDHYVACHHAEKFL